MLEMGLFEVLCGNVGQTASLSSANWQFTLQNHTKPQRATNYTVQGHKLECQNSILTAKIEFSHS